MFLCLNTVWKLAGQLYKDRPVGALLRMFVFAGFLPRLMATNASTGSRAALARQWDAWDAELVHLAEALAHASTPPPPQEQPKRPTAYASQPSFPLANTAPVAAARPPISPELIRALEVAPVEAMAEMS